MNELTCSRHPRPESNAMCHSVRRWMVALLFASGSGTLGLALADSLPPSTRSATTIDTVPHSVDGIGTAARFGSPIGLAIDSKGNLFVVDSTDKVIRRIVPSGVVSTFAGFPGKGGHSDGNGPNARFASPHSIAIDKFDNMYVTDSYNETIRKITPSAEVTIFAGSNGHAGIADGDRTAATFDFPQGITIDSEGNLYVLAESAIRKVSPDGRVTTLAGHTTAGYPAAVVGYRDGQGTSARFNAPFGIAIDAQNNLFVTDRGNFVIREVSPSGLVVTIAGASGERESHDGPGSTARFGTLGGLSIDTHSNIYVADSPSALVRKISTSREVTTVLATDDFVAAPAGAARIAGISYASAIAVDSTGVLYIAVGGRERHNRWDGAILKLLPNGELTTFAGPSVDIVSTNRRSARIQRSDDYDQ